MAIQMRRGEYDNFDPTKMLAGEWAIVTSGDPNTATGRAVYHCFVAGQVERVATYADAAQIIINAIPETVDALTEAVEEAEKARGEAEAEREQKVITSATATVDNNTGTPSVEVSLGQPSALGRAISFVFHNLKGTKGDTVSVEPITTTQIDDVVADTSVTSDNALTATGLTYLWGKLKAAFAAISHNHAAGDITSGTLGVARGGTGADTHTSNAVLTGNGTSAVNDVATADGALYATAANGAAQFGTLPVAQGGTGGTTAALARSNLSVPSTSELGDVAGSIADVESSTTATANHAQGDYFMLGNVLMVATSAIATGETISSSNATPATVQSQIDSIRDSLYPTVRNLATLSNNVTEGMIWYYIVGSVCFVAIIDIKVKEGIANGSLIASGLPHTGTQFTIIAPSIDQGYRNLRMRLDPDGTLVTHYSSTTNTNHLGCSFSYIVA